MKIGLATLEITPPFLMPMGGFGIRVDHADGTHDPLLLTALYFRQENREVWLVVADLVQFPDGEPLDQGLQKISQALGCQPEALFLHTTHTHGGPQMLIGYGIDTPQKRVHRSPQNQVLIRKYHDFLWDKVIAACETARRTAFPGRLLYGEGTTSFPMNRRALVNGRIENAPNPDGPVDNRLRLLGIEDGEGNLRALGMILAAHPTSTGAQHRFTADYVGAWRVALKESLGNGVEPFFLQGCGGDARPAYTCGPGGEHWEKTPLEDLPRHTRSLVGETLALLRKGLRPLGKPKVASGHATIELRCQPLYTDEESLLPLKDSPVSWVREYADACLQRLSRGEVIPDTVSLRLATLQLAEELTLVGMGCEPLCGLGRKIEAAFPATPLAILGYTSGCFGYLPDTEELLRGGYEAESYLFEPWSGPFFPGVEDEVIAGIRALLEK